jgi:hypothetical protein
MGVYSCLGGRHMRRLVVFILALTIGCGARNQGQAVNDAGDQLDVGTDAGQTADHDANAALDVGRDGLPDAASEHADMDAAGGDGGPFACGTLTCHADEYCVPMIWTTCQGAPDGGECPTGRSACDRGGGQMGCHAPCYQQGCAKTLPFGCTVSNVPAPRWLYCTCE